MWISRSIKPLLLCFMLVVFGVLAAQAQAPCSYQVLTNGTYSSSVLQQALDQAKLDAYRRRTTQRILQFDQGARVVLFSALDLTERGCPVNPLVAMDDHTPIDENRTFTVHSSGVIMETVSRPVKQ